MNMNDTITFAPYMRALLLEAICSRMDIIDYCKYFHHLTFKKSINHTYTGDCPYCSGHKSFCINSSTGKIYCMACKQEGDFLTLVSKQENINLDITLHRLSGYIEAVEKRKATAYAACTGGEG